jgi:protein-S-isoprenylcysteine O-methyltransferase Ste14
VGNLPVPQTVDVGAAVPIAQAVAVNALLLALFAAQHSVMARVGFKRSGPA